MNEKPRRHAKENEREYIVLELYREYARRTSVLVDADGSFTCKESVLARVSALGPTGIAAQLAHLLRTPLHERAQIVLLFDTESSVLVQNEATVNRPDWNAEITASEFEGAVRRSIAQLHQRERAAAARLLGTHELQLQLADVDLMQVRVDGHRVVSPIGYRSHDIAVMVRQCFVRSETWHHIISRIAPAQIIAVTTRGGFWASCVGMALHDAALVLDIDENQTTIYEVHDGAVSWRDTVLWGSQHVCKSIVAPFGLPIAFAPQLLDLLRQRACSQTVASILASALRAEFSLLSHTIEAHQSRRALPVFLASAFEPPILAFLSEIDAKVMARTPCSFLDFTFVSKAVVHYSKNHLQESLAPSFAAPLAVVARIAVSTQGVLLQKSPNQRMRWIAQ